MTRDADLMTRRRIAALWHRDEPLGLLLQQPRAHERTPFTLRHADATSVKLQLEGKLLHRPPRVTISYMVTLGLLLSPVSHIPL